MGTVHLYVCDCAFPHNSWIDVLHIVYHDQLISKAIPIGQCYITNSTVDQVVLHFQFEVNLAFMPVIQ